MWWPAAFEVGRPGGSLPPFPAAAALRREREGRVLPAAALPAAGSSLRKGVGVSGLAAGIAAGAGFPVCAGGDSGSRAGVGRAGCGW